MVTIKDYWSTFTVSQFHNYCLSNTLCDMFPRYNAPDSDESGSESGYSESSSSSGSSSTSVGSTSKVINKMRNLSLNQVLCMDTAEEAGDQSQAAANGKSVDRIKQSMKKPCCNKRCKRNLMFKTVFAFCVAFWSLSKSGQDCLLLGFCGKHHT